MKLFGSTQGKITKTENGVNVPYLEITEVVLMHCDIANNNYQRNSRLLYAFVPNNFLVSYQIFHLKILQS